jgi:hypothetical protein
MFQKIQVSELEVELEKVKGEKATPTRFLKSQQLKQAKMAAEAAAAAGNAEGENVTVLVNGIMSSDVMILKVAKK